MFTQVLFPIRKANFQNILKKESKEFSERKKTKEKRRERKKEEEKRLVTLPNRLVSTFHYVEINEDGTKNPFTIQELELNNFQILFRYFLESLVCPSYENLEPVINWKLRPIGQGHVGHLSGPEDSSAASSFLQFFSSSFFKYLFPFPFKMAKLLDFWHQLGQYQIILIATADPTGKAIQSVIDIR